MVLVLIRVNVWVFDALVARSLPSVLGSYF